MIQNLHKKSPALKDNYTTDMVATLGNDVPSYRSRNMSKVNLEDDACQCCNLC